VFVLIFPVLFQSVRSAIPEHDPAAVMRRSEFAAGHKSVLNCAQACAQVFSVQIFTRSVILNLLIPGLAAPKTSCSII